MRTAGFLFLPYSVLLPLSSLPPTVFLRGALHHLGSLFKSNYNLILPLTLDPLLLFRYRGLHILQCHFTLLAWFTWVISLLYQFWNRNLDSGQYCLQLFVCSHRFTWICWWWSHFNHDRKRIQGLDIWTSCFTWEFRASIYLSSTSHRIPVFILLTSPSFW